MGELIKTFHIETNLLLAQMINFVIVLLVLYKFAYKPILKILNERTEKIEKGLKDSDAATKKLEKISLEEKEVLAKAKKEAQEILKKAEGTAKINRETSITETKQEAEKLLENTKEQIEREKERIMSEIKGEVAQLVVAATSKVIEEKIDPEKDKELIEKAIRQ